MANANRVGTLARRSARNHTGPTGPDLAAKHQDVSARLAALAVPALALAMPACDLAQQPAEPLPPGAACETWSTAAPTLTTREVDLLFVVSEAPSMLRHADVLHARLRTLGHVLETLEGGMPSVHVAVPDGAAPAERCGIGPEPWLRDVRVPWFWCDVDVGEACHDRNYASPWADALACLAHRAADGDRPAPVLARAVAALEGGAAAFLRPQAALVVVIITADDDASPGPVERYIDELRALAATRAIVYVALVAPLDAPRLRAVRDAFPNRAELVDVEGDSWTDVVASLGSWDDRIANPCLPLAQPDVDPDAPGVQADCVATDDQLGLGPLLPRCTMSTADRPAPDTPLPCYWIREVDPAEYGCAQIALVERERFGPSLPPLRCGCEPFAACDAAQPTEPLPGPVSPIIAP